MPVLKSAEGRKNLLNNFKKNSGELEEEYIYRVCSQKELIGSWPEVANIINGELGYEYTESKYRKQFQAFTKMLEANKSIFNSSDCVIDEIKKQKDELYKEKVRFFDQRREYNRDLTYDARAEHLSDCLVDAASRLNRELPLSDTCGRIGPVDGSKEAVLVISDIHYGMVTDNIWNKYNTNICRLRLRELVDKSVEYINFNKPTRLHIVLLGDCAHGAIHTTARIMSEETVCDQLMNISELLAEVIAELSNSVMDTLVYSTYGNHMRTVQSKKESVHNDNMERILPWWLKQRLADREDIHIIDSNYYEFIHLNVLGNNIVATHGDLDNFKQLGIVVNSIFTRLFGKSIDYTISADKHHLEEFEQLGIESTLVRSMCGTDDYANGKRLYSNPGQTLMMFTESGKDCTYNIKFSN